jgi:hypothetical protein
VIVIALVGGLVRYVHKEPTNDATTSSATTPGSEHSVGTPNNTLGETTPELSYTIFGRKNDSVGRIVKIRVSRAATEQEQLPIASAVRANEKGYVKRLIVWFFLSGSAGKEDIAWAVANFGPDPKVTIQGFTPQKLTETATALSASGNMLGRWIWDAGTASSVIGLSRDESGRMVVNERFMDGSVRKKPLRESKSSRGRRFVASDLDEYYVLLPDGNLEISDKEGLIFVAKPYTGP